MNRYFKACPFLIFVSFLFSSCAQNDSGKPGSQDSLTEDQKTAILRKAVALLKDRKKHSLRLIRTWDFSHNEIHKTEVAVRKRAGFTQIKHGTVLVWKGLGGVPPLNPHHFILSRIASEGKI